MYGFNILILIFGLLCLFFGFIGQGISIIYHKLIKQDNKSIIDIIAEYEPL